MVSAEKLCSLYGVKYYVFPSVCAFLPASLTEELEARFVLLLIPMYTGLACGRTITPYAAVYYTFQYSGHPTIYVAVRHKVGLVPLNFKAYGYVFQRILRLYAK